MIGTQLIEHAVRLAIFSTAIKDEKSVSIMLIAKPEFGKSEILKKFADVESVKITTNFDTFVFSEFAFEYQKGKKRTIIIPDFLNVTKKKQSTANNALMIMNAITEEGWTGKLPLGISFNEAIKANIITGLTEDEMTDKRHRWTSSGLMTRFVPISYSYNSRTEQMIREYIKDRFYNSDKPFNFIIPQHQQTIVLPKQFAEQLEIFAKVLAIKNNITGFRLQRQLQTLAMSNALAQERSIVNQGDVDVIAELTTFINFNYTKI